MLKQIYKYIPNQFSENVEVEDEYRESLGKFFTILYFVITSLAIVVLSLLFGLQKFTVQKVVERPTLEQYQNELASKNPTCRCSEVAIPFRRFSSFDFQMDNLCLAVSMDYVTALELYTNFTTYPGSCPSDKVCLLTPWPIIIRSFRKLCYAAWALAYSTQSTLLNSSFISPQLVSEEIVSLEFQTRLNSATAELPILFTQPLAYIELWSGANLPFLIFNISTLGEAAFVETTAHEPYFFTGPGPWSEFPESSCDCRIDWTCPGCDSLQKYLDVEFKNNDLPFDNSSGVPPNLHMTMQFIETLQSSTYNTAREAISFMFIPEYEGKVSYENYYNSCKPAECSYVINETPTMIALATVVFGLIGGVSSGLQQGFTILVNLLVKWHHYKYKADHPGIELRTQKIT